MSQVTGWLNTSPTKSSVWVKPKGGLLNESIFVNLESKAALEVLVSLLREAYAKRASFEMPVNIADIKRGKSGMAFVSMTLSEVLNSMTETQRTEVSVDEAAAKKAAAILAELQGRPAPAPAPTPEVVEVDFD